MVKRKRGRIRVISNAMRTYKFRLECFISLSNAGAIASQSYFFPLNYPTYFINAAGTWGQMAGTTIPQEFAGLLLCFAEYQVHKLDTRYISNTTDTGLPATGSAEVPSIIYIAKDNVNANIASTEAYMLNSGVYPKTIENGRSIMFHQSQLKQNRGKYLRIQNMSVANPTLTTNNLIQLPGVAEPYAGTRIYLPNVSATAWVGRIYLTYHISFRCPVVG